MKTERSHQYIFISGFLAALVYTILNYFVLNQRDFLTLFLQFIIFYVVWIIIQYVLFKKR